MRLFIKNNLKHTLNIHLNTFSYVSVMFCLVPWGVSGLPISYSPHPADPIRDDQSLICPTVYTT